jgi:type III secretory pathway component EscR
MLPSLFVLYYCIVDLILGSILLAVTYSLIQIAWIAEPLSKQYVFFLQNSGSP